MSLKCILLAGGAALALLVPVTDAFAQYQYQHQYQDRQRLDRPRNTSAPVVSRPASQKPQAAAVRTTAVADSKPVVPSSKPAPEPPLTAEQLAAKAEVDELLSREPALSAARHKPDPAMIRAAAARHDAQEKQLAAQRIKDQTAALKRKEAGEKPKAREDAKKAVVPNPKPDPKAKSATPKAAPVSKPGVVVTSSGPSRVTSSQPVLRLPLAEGLPVPRNL